MLEHVEIVCFDSPVQLFKPGSVGQEMVIFLVRSRQSCVSAEQDAEHELHSPQGFQIHACAAKKK